MGCFGGVQIFMSAAVLYSILTARAVWAQGPSQAGFISIDCGATSSYVDQPTGLVWVPDTNYTSGGVNFAGVPGSTTFLATFSTVRYFPKPQKYCYELPGTTPNASYLIRHSYWYGNYDGLNKPPSFNVALDSAEAGTVNISGITSPYYSERIYKARKNSIIFCLYPDATNSTPFISSLELRPFQAGAYEQKTLMDGGALIPFLRLNYGGPANNNLRFPDDVYDRIWLSWPFDGVTISTVSPVDPNNHPLMPPSAVMQTASSSAVLGPVIFLKSVLSLLSSSTSAEAFVNLFFAEIGTTSSATSRAFNISLSGNVPVVTENPYVDARGAFKADVKSFTSWVVGSTSSITLIPLATATDPPLLNAIEVYGSMAPSTTTTAAADVLAIEQIKQALNLTLSSAGDPCLPVPIAWVTCSPAAPTKVIAVKLSNYNLTGEIPTAFTLLSALTDLWLDNNALTGIIPDLSKLTSLKSLHLENNALSGTLPASLGTLPLTELFLQNNKFVGMVPDSLIRNGLLLDLTGNPGITDPRVNSGLSIPPSPATPNGGSTKPKTNISLIAGVVGGIVGAIVLIGCVGAIWIVLWRKKDGSELSKSKSLESSKGPSHRPIESGLVPGAQRYSYAEITAATNGFKKKIGSGGFGPVHYGRLLNGQEVAIKTLDIHSRQGAQEFTNEVELLSRIHHKNLVKLLGYCEEGNHQMLVYEFLHKGTVQEHLYGSSSAAREPLDFKSRLDIALNAAQGLEYLHKGCNPNIIHRDIKSNNILLTDKYVAKVADFGLSKLGAPDTATHVVTGVKGTIGYLDPEYYVSNSLTEKSDVFSFGVVLLEILCARPPIDQNIPDQNNWNICNWVRASLQTGNIDHILDSVISKEHPNMDVVWKVAELAIQCVEPKGKHRPSMQDVVRELREAVSLNSSLGTYANFVGNSTYQFRPSNGSGDESAHSSKNSRAQDSNNSMVQPRTR